MTIRTITSLRIREAANASEAFNGFILKSIHRHLSGDWGDISEHDKEVNATNRFCALGIYTSSDDVTIWIKQDYNILTVLFPSEY